MLSSTAVKTTRPIHIRLTAEYLEVYVAPELFRRGTSSPSSLGQDLGNWLKSLVVLYPKQEKLLLVLSRGTRGLSGSEKTLFRVMRNVAGSMDWTVEEFQYQRRLSRHVDIWRCLDICRMAKLL